MNTSENLIKNGNVSLYGYKEKHLPDILLQKNQGWVRVFIKKDQKRINFRRFSFPVNFYKNMREIRKNSGEVCFLDNEALKALLVGFPSSKYVLARISFSSFRYWPLGLPGLLRRVFKKWIWLKKIIKLSAAGKNCLWLVLERKKEDLAEGLFFSIKIGLKEFFNCLCKEKINYVVLKFFYDLSKYQQKEKDVDILVADEDKLKLIKFLERHQIEGGVKIHIISPSFLGPSGIPYYPPFIARKILESAVDGSVGSRIPSPKESFLSFVYHVLYHEGVNAGVPSRLSVEVNPHPKNDYVWIINRMAKELNINIPIEMEALDDYLFREGWRLPIDTLAKIAEHNEWVYHRFFSKRKVQENSLAVFIIREKAFQLGVVGSILSAIKKDGFIVLRKKRLSGLEQKHAAECLRGGVWVEGEAADMNDGFLPAIALVVLDLYSPYFKNQEKFFQGFSRFGILKERLRSAFDKGKMSLVHSTDNNDDAWEYIKVCFSSEISVIKKEIKYALEDSQLPLKERIKINLKMIPYHKRRIIAEVKRSIINFLIK